MIGYIFLSVNFFEIASKVNNIFALICMLGIGAFFFFRSKGADKVDKTTLYVLSGLAVVLCVIGAYAHVQTPKNLEEENKGFGIMNASLQDTIKAYKFKFGECEEARKNCARDSAQLAFVNAKNAELIIENTQLKAQITQLKNRTIKGDGNLLALDGRPYGYAQNYAVVKNKLGKWGYLHRGQFISKVDFEYKAACRFYSGMAGVQNSEYKWGFIDSGLDLVIPHRYEDAFGFQGDSAKVKLNGSWIWINRRGELIGEVVKQ